VGGDFEAASFDGSDDYFPVDRSIQDDFTILAWVKADFPGAGADDSQFYVGSGLIYADVPGGANDFGTAITGMTFGFGLGNPDVTIHSTTPVADGFWHLVAGVREVTLGSGAQFRLYVDGVLQATSPHTNSSPLNAPALITIGGNTVDRRYFGGSLDEIALFGTALSDADISGAFSAYSGLTPCFTPDKTTGAAPLTIQFDASCSTSTQADISSYAWDFGDGETGTGQK